MDINATIIGFFFAAFLVQGEPPILFGPYSERDICWVEEMGAYSQGYETMQCELMAVSIDMTVEQSPYVIAPKFAFEEDAERFGYVYLSNSDRHKTD